MVTIDLITMINITHRIAIQVYNRGNLHFLQVSDVYVVYLAVSDIGHPVVAYPMIIASSFHHGWIFGDDGE